MFAAEVDILYWNPQEDGLAVGIEQSTNTIKNAHLDWGWGFRIAFDAQFKHDAWDARLSWTCLPIQNDTEVTAPLLPTWSRAVTSPSDFVSHAKAHWRLHLGIVDLEVRRMWHISPSFSLTPKLGVRFASIRQKFFITYSGGSLFPDAQDQFHTKNKYWGVGPEAGFDFTYWLSSNWTLTGQMGGALLDGEFYVHDAETTLPSHTHHLKLFNIFPMGCAIWDMALGVQWLREDYSLFALFEHHFFPNQNQLSPTLSSTSPGVIVSNLGNLSLIGVTLGAQWHF